MHYYKFNIADWYLSTSHLSLEEEAIYFRLVNHYYDTEEPIPLDTQSVVRRLRMGDRAEIADAILKEYFHETSKGWVHSRCNEILTNFKKQRAKNAANGAKGGRPKRNKGLDDSEQKPTGFKKQSQKKPNQEPLTTNHNNNKPMSTNADVRLVFDHWVLVMKKTGQAKLTKKRSSCVTARLREGYTTDQLKSAIDGCARSPHHMGQNDTGTVYDDLELICRSGEKVEHFSNNIQRGGSHGPGQRIAKQTPSERIREQALRVIANAEDREAGHAAVDPHDGSVRGTVVIQGG